MSLRIEATPGHVVPETYIHRETGEQQAAALVTPDNLHEVAAWCGGRVAGRSVMVPDAKHGSSWTAAVGCYVLQGQPYPVRVGREFEAEYALKSIVDANLILHHCRVDLHTDRLRCTRSSQHLFACPEARLALVADVLAWTQGYECTDDDSLSAHSRDGCYEQATLALADIDKARADD